MSENSQQEITLISSDDQEFKVTQAVASMSPTIINHIKNSKIHFDNITGPVLSKIIQYCEHHSRFAYFSELQEWEDEKSENIVPWDQNFVSNLSSTMKFDLVSASHFLDIKPLLNLICKDIANSLKGKSPEELRKILDIKELTDEEKEQVKKENEWCEF